MKKASLLSVILIIISTGTVLSQKKHIDKFLHFGAGLGYSHPYMNMGNNSEGFEFYFANEKNETIKADYTWDNKVSTNFPIYPNLYVQFDLGNHLFFRLDMFALWFSNNMNIRNSVDAGDFFEAYSEQELEAEGDDVTDYSSFGYNNIEMNWGFIGNSFVVGYTFLKTKSIKPYVILGASSMYLIKFGPSNIEESNPRYYRTQAIFASVDTFDDITYYGVFGFGAKYRGLSLEFLLQGSPSVDNGQTYYSESTYSYTVNYESFLFYNISLKANLFSKNLNKNKLSKK